MLSNDVVKNVLAVLFFVSVLFYLKLSFDSSLNEKPDFDQITCLTKKDLEEILDSREILNSSEILDSPEILNRTTDEDSQENGWHLEDPREYLRSLNLSISYPETKSFCNHTFEHGQLIFDRILCFIRNKIIFQNIVEKIFCIVLTAANLMNFLEEMTLNTSLVFEDASAAALSTIKKVETFITKGTFLDHY